MCYQLINLKSMWKLPHYLSEKNDALSLVEYVVNIGKPKKENNKQVNN